MDPHVKYLLSLRAVRERAQVVWQAAEAGELAHFDLHKDKLGDVADFVISRDFGPDKYDTIPPHGRWQHFDVGNVPRVQNMIDSWKTTGTDDLELTRRLIDLFSVSVLLDAGAGDYWRFVEPQTGRKYERSEGIAVASLYMFNSVAFTDAVSEKTPSVNDSRAALLRSIGESLLKNPGVFGEQGRPGNLVDYMIKTAENSSELDVLKFWDVLQTLLIPCWPKDRTTVNGFPIGDAWPLSTLKKHTDPSKADDVTAGIQPFHKLTQWLTYSLMVPFQRILDIKWKNTESLTALPEYRNGGLFVDLGAITLKKEAYERGIKASGKELPLFDAADDVIVEWRALTLNLLDRVYESIVSRMGQGVHLTMAQVLEAGTWKSGREIAAQRRPETKSSPILIRSDGTVF
ncbi:urg3 [Diaporthe amygdali]|uniref:urg3 n=1 Tax=Phomopsis amygdali TaxID=1214568 RepID=UPI0022FEA019|nr:urg3 [Diaporthe amygdali]KAJ0115147.1 urg3 [Diaporthe amygdali]